MKYANNLLVGAARAEAILEAVLNYDFLVLTRFMVTVAALQQPVWQN